MKICAFNNLGEYGELANPAALVYNKGVSYGNSTLVHGMELSTAIAEHEAAMLGFSSQSSNSRKNNILEVMPIYTVFYIDTHGDPESFGDCLALSTSGDD